MNCSTAAARHLASGYEAKNVSFGHRVHKNYDPTAKVIKKLAEKVFSIVDRDPLIDEFINFKFSFRQECISTAVAVALEKTALSDEYFIKRKLYPNVDFYSGLMHRAMGCPPEYFTVLFALPRMAGYLAHWRESLDDPDTKIMRPKQDFLILRFAFEISGIYWGMAEALYATERGDGVTRCRQVR
ncbi:hypothetical protein SLEP1_g56367 [Rubroshorea leprosula]|uniref:Citrate synthase n=1 Tax=Rubroshorea leprosula TaxID=152421 RepID=A0AAV5MI42_9ROSI|nr:hypothetical protein SLEP1_g56367 [Rubroshorea leprosula]